LNQSSSLIQCNSILDSGSFCNFISEEFASSLNIQPQICEHKIIVKGITGATTSINKYINLKFSINIIIENKVHLLQFNDNFLISNYNPIDLLFGNQFMKKYFIHYDYDKKILYSSKNLKFFKLNLLLNSLIKNPIKNFENFHDPAHLKNFKNSKNDDNATLESETAPCQYNTNSNVSNDTNIINETVPDKFYCSSKNQVKLDNCTNNNNNQLHDSSSINNNKHNVSRNIEIEVKNYPSADNSDYNYNFLIHCFLADKYNNNSSDIIDDDDDSPDPPSEEIPAAYRDLSVAFSKQEADKLPPHRLTDCKIVLEKDASLHYGPIYPLTQEEEKVLREYIEENLEKGFIRPSESPAGYPVVFQKKKDGTLRVCIDYKKLNAVTVRNSYPLPLITDIIERVKGAKFFTKLDLRSAYNLIRIQEGDEYKTAFRTKFGHYEYLVMPFGLKNAPATFQSFINAVLRPYLDKFVILYLDDILIFSKNLEEHHNHVRMVLQKLIENNLYVKLSKCEFDQEKVEFLGYVLSGKGISTDPKKIAAIKEWPVPKNIKDVQRFVGLCNYYRRFVKNFSNIAKPLHNLTKNNVKFIWDNKCEQAFNELKTRLTTAPILRFPDPQKQFIVECDASNFAIGAVLSQYDDNKILHPVAYYSRNLSNTEINYSITDKELLSIKSAFYTWRHLLLGGKHKVLVYTDHRNLLYTLGGKIQNQRQHRWHLFFQEYNFELIYRQGRKNGKPDCLSRRPDYENNVNYNNDNNDEFILDSSNINTVHSYVSILSDLFDRIINELKTDSTAEDIRLYFSDHNKKEGYPYKPFRKMNKFKIENNLILYNNLIYIPEALRLEILIQYHENPSAGHLGIKRTEELISRNFWWPKLHEDVTGFVNSCEVCTRNKVSKHKKYGLLQPLETPHRPWYSIEIDFLCGLPDSNGYTVLMVVVDRFSKMFHLIPFKQIPDTKQTADAFLNNIYRLHGLPHDIITDRGPQFTSTLWKDILEELNVKSIVATTDHHETVGQVERCNNFIEQYLRCYSRSFYHDDWSKWIYLAEFVYNNAINESTKESPFFINYGFHPAADDYQTLESIVSKQPYIKDLSEHFNHVREVLLRSKDLYKRAADKKRMVAPSFQKGDKVWIQAPPSFTTEEVPKLAPCKYGPYKVLEVLSNNNYKIDIKHSPFPKHHPIFHISELEPFIPTPEKFANRPVNGEKIKEIIEISGFRTNYKEKRYEYRVRYKYSLRNHWVPASEVEDDPKNQNIFLLYNQNKRKPVSLSYN